MLVELPVWLIVLFVVLIIGATLTGIFIVVRTIYVITRTFLTVQRVETKLEQLDHLGSVIFQIANEFKNDSGSTLKDTIDALEREGKIQNEAAILIRASLNNLRAEQTQLALFQQRQPAVALENVIAGHPVNITNISGQTEQASAGQGNRQARE